MRKRRDDEFEIVLGISKPDEDGDRTYGFGIGKPGKLGLRFTVEPDKPTGTWEYGISIGPIDIGGTMRGLQTQKDWITLGPLEIATDHSGDKMVHEFKFLDNTVASRDGPHRPGSQHHDRDLVPGAGTTPSASTTGVRGITALSGDGVDDDDWTPSDQQVRDFRTAHNDARNVDARRVDPTHVGLPGRQDNPGAYGYGDGPDRLRAERVREMNEAADRQRAADEQARASVRQQRSWPTVRQNASVPPKRHSVRQSSVPPRRPNSGVRPLRPPQGTALQNSNAIMVAMRVTDIHSPAAVRQVPLQGCVVKNAVGVVMAVTAGMAVTAAMAAAVMALTMDMVVDQWGGGRLSLT